MERSAEGNAVYTINDMNMPDDLKWWLIPKKSSSISVRLCVLLLFSLWQFAWQPQQEECVAHCLCVQIFIQLKRIIIESESRTKKHLKRMTDKNKKVLQITEAFAASICFECDKIQRSRDASDTVFPRISRLRADGGSSCCWYLSSKL